MKRVLFGHLIGAWLAFTCTAQAEAIRVASYNTELSREGPGLLLRDIEDRTRDTVAIAQIIASAKTDIIALQGVDWDVENRTLKALQSLIAAQGELYKYTFTLRPNSGLETSLDMDGNGRLGEAADAQGFGAFSGQGGLALLSKFPINKTKALNYSDLLWRDLPGAQLPVHPDGTPFPSAQAQDNQRLSSTGHWIIPVSLPDGTTLKIMCFQAGPPVFDGPEDRNGLRNRDEIRIWAHLLDGTFGEEAEDPFVIVGGANLDPFRGQGHRNAIQGLLSHVRIQDPVPKDNSAKASPATVEWERVGPMRVDYVLPSSGLTVLSSGVLWPLKSAERRTASRHRLVWVDMEVGRKEEN